MTTPDRILNEATRLFAEKGFAVASVREICAAAGVSKPVLYYHFASRDGLVLAVLKRVGTRFHQVTQRHLQDVAPSREALIDLVAALLDMSSDDRWLMRVLHRLSELSPAILTHLPAPEHQERPMRVFLERGIEDGTFAPDTDPRAVIWMLLGAFGHLGSMALHHPAEGSSRELAERLVRQVLPTVKERERSIENKERETTAADAPRRSDRETSAVDDAENKTGRER